jgi:hypothetical protein
MALIATKPAAELKKKFIGIVIPFIQYLVLFKNAVFWIQNDPTFFLMVSNPT